MIMGTREDPVIARPVSVSSETGAVVRVRSGTFETHPLNGCGPLVGNHRWIPGLSSAYWQGKEAEVE
jgi:hypothetical protein